MTGAVGNTRSRGTHFRKSKNNSLVRTLLSSNYAGLLLAVERNSAVNGALNGSLGANVPEDLFQYQDLGLIIDMSCNDAYQHALS